MKILLISGTLPPDGAAVSALIKKLLPQFESKGAVHGLTVKRSFSETSEIADGTFLVDRAHCVIGAPDRMVCVRDVFLKISCAIQRRVLKKKTAVYNNSVVRGLVKKMREMPMNEYDAVIAVCAFYDVAEALLRYKKKFGLSAKIALYQVDPLTENLAYHGHNREKLVEYERNLFSSFDCVFTTPIIYKKKMADGWELDNVVDLEFPLSLREKGEGVSNGDEVRCVFAGFLYGNIRDASHTLRLFSLMKNKNVHLYILGSGQRDILQQYQEILGERLHILGEVPTTECDEILASADVLVNIGNRVKNQVPSKLLHYIGFGKPILNIMGCDECPTIAYMEKYPLSLSISEDEPLEVAAEKVEEWISNSQGKCISPQEITDAFYECTPEYIAQQMISKINEV